MRLLSALSWHTGLTGLAARVATRTQLRVRPIAGMPFPRLCQRPHDSFQILVYHRVAPSDDPFDAGISIHFLQRQIETLHKLCTLADLEELISKVRRHEPIPPNSVALTFDDGYRDNFEHVFPLLKKLGAPATIFLTTAFINQDDVPWNDKVTYALRTTRRGSLELTFDGQSQRYPLGNWMERLASRNRLLWFMRHIPHQAKLALLLAIQEQLEIADFEPLRGSMLTWDQVREMHQGGIRFGAHTVTHPILTRISLEEAWKEIKESKEVIESVIGTPIELFAYPAGTPADFNEPIKHLVRRAGFAAAVTTVFGFNSRHTDPCALHRGGSSATDIPSFAMQQVYYRLTN
jgi:peptidoglycan/xylan/chitin deacetylase (PgdA/CDA1 family)